MLVEILLILHFKKINMKKVLFGIALLISSSLFAQEAQVQTVKIKNENASGWVINFDESKKTVEKVILDEFSKQGVKNFKNDKGFKSAKGEMWKMLNNEQRDIYFKVTGNKKKSEVSLVVATGYNNYINAQTHAEQFQNMGAFLNSLSEKIAEYTHQEDLNDLQKQIDKLEKTKAKAEKKNKKIEKSIEKSEKQMKSNNSAIEKTESSIEKLKTQLENMK